MTSSAFIFTLASEVYHQQRYEGFFSGGEVRVGATSNFFGSWETGKGEALKEYLLSEFCLGSGPALMLFLALELGKGLHSLITNPR